MIASVTNQGKLRFMVYAGALNSKIFLAFLRRLIRDVACKVFVIVDNLRVHRAKVVRAWVADHADRIAVVYLPPYAPAFHPEEYVNNDLKQTLARHATPREGGDESWPDRPYARPATSARQGACVLPGTRRALCRMKPGVIPIWPPG
jgi:transposase